MNFNSLTALGKSFGQINDLPLSRIPDVSLREHANMGCILLSSAVDATEVLSDAEASLAVELPHGPGEVKRRGGHTGIWLSPRSWLLLCDPKDETGICERVLEAFPDRRLHASPFTDYLCWFSLTGARSEDLLRQGSVISLSKKGLPAGCARRTLVNGTATVLYHEDDLTWLIGVERSRAVFFFQWLDSLNII